MQKQATQQAITSKNQAHANKRNHKLAQHKQTQKTIALEMRI